MSAATIVVTQRERFGMTQESLESLIEHTPGAAVIYVDGSSPTRPPRATSSERPRPGRSRCSARSGS